MVLLTIFSMKFSLDSKKEVLKDYANYISLEDKINKIVFLKKKYNNRSKSMI